MTEQACVPIKVFTKTCELDLGSVCQGPSLTGIKTNKQKKTHPDEFNSIYFFQGHI